jgi:hypothetical protein
VEVLSGTSSSESDPHKVSKGLAVGRGMKEVTLFFPLPTGFIRWVGEEEDEVE